MPHWWTCPVSGHNSHRLQLGMYNNYTATNRNNHISEWPQKGTAKKQKIKPQTETATNRMDHALKRPQIRWPKICRISHCSQTTSAEILSIYWKTLSMPSVGRDVAVSVCGRFGLCLWPFWSVAASVCVWFVPVSVCHYFGCGPLSMWLLQTVTISQLWHSVMTLFICCFRSLTSGNLYYVCWK